MVCLNCESQFNETDKYCRNCGQPTSTRRLNTAQVASGFAHSFTHADRGFLDLIPKLLYKPGIIAREYNQGKRKTYFNPFTFVLIVVGVSTLLVSTFNFMSFGTQGQQHKAVSMVTTFINKHFNIVVFLSIPLIAFFSSRFFSKRMNFAEALVLVSYTSGERSIFFCLVIIPLVLLLPGSYYPIVYSYLVLFMTYYAWACAQYLQDHKPFTYLKAVLSFLFSQITISLLISLVIFSMIMLQKMQTK